MRRTTALVVALALGVGFLGGAATSDDAAETPPPVGDFAAMTLPPMTLDGESDVVAVRDELVRKVWPEGLPAVLPVDGVVRMPHGVDSHLRGLVPEDPSCAVVVWHGHSDITPGVDRFAEDAYERGCVVVVGWMPMFGPNPHPVVSTPDGPVRLGSHDSLRLVDDVPTLRFFLEPAAAAVNLLSERWPNLPVTMVGLSGGGWLTTVYAALDERVRLSIPIAGTLPDFLRSYAQADWGDYEQHHPDLPDYLDLYAAATTDGRRQVQVLIEGDPCCFDARGGRHRIYEGAVADLAAGWGGGFEVRTFAQRSHAIGTTMRYDLLDLLAYAAE